MDANTKLRTAADYIEQVRGQSARLHAIESIIRADLRDRTVGLTAPTNSETAGLRYANRVLALTSH